MVLLLLPLQHRELLGRQGARLGSLQLGASQAVLECAGFERRHHLLLEEAEFGVGRRVIGVHAQAQVGEQRLAGALLLLG